MRLDRPKDQPHAIAHVLQPTLWGENQKREPVSITGDAQRMVPHAPEPSPGAPKGNKVSARHGRRCGRHVRCWPFRDVLIPPNGRFAPMIGIGGSLAAPPLPHHRTYGSVYGGSRSYANAHRSGTGDRAI